MIQNELFFRRLLWPILLAGIGFALLTFQAAWASGTLLADPAETAVNQPTNGLANCRYGLAPVEAPHEPWVPTLGAGWYLEFFATTIDPPTSNDAEFVQVIRIKQDRNSAGDFLPSYTSTPPLGSHLNNLIQQNKSAVWVIGNEVDRGPNPNGNESIQDATYPEIYAQAYHDISTYIKSRDATARIANSALVQVTPNRIQYLDKMWQAHIDTYGYPMAVDIWNMHLYILPEVNAQGEPNGIANIALGTDPTLAKRESGGNAANCILDNVYCFAEHDDLTIFAEQIRDMRQWMKDHGQQNRPLMLSEYSILYPYEVDGSSCFLQDEFGNCFTPNRVQQFMEQTFNYLETAKDANLGYPLDNGRLVQQWLWFSGHSFSLGKVSNLVNDNLSGLTPLGAAYQAHVQQHAPTRNLIVDHADFTITSSSNVTGTVTATLSVDIRNNGNHAITTPYTVAFFADAARTIPIGSTVIDTTQRGCGTHAVTASVEWPSLTTGHHPFWVLVDSEDTILETPSGINDNLGSGFVLVDPEQINLPLVRR